MIVGRIDVRYNTHRRSGRARTLALTLEENGCRLEGYCWVTTQAGDVFAVAQKLADRAIDWCLSNIDASERPAIIAAIRTAPIRNING